MKDWLIQRLHRTPFIGGLLSCARDDFFEASQELFVNFIVGTAPIWTGALFILLHVDESRNFIEILSANIRQGELIIYCTTFLAPIFYIIFRERKMKGRFPSSSSINLLSCLILLTVTGIFALQRAGYDMNPDLIFIISISLFIISLFLLLLSITYNNSRIPGAPDEFQHQDTQFQKKLESHMEK